MAALQIFIGDSGSWANGTRLQASSRKTGLPAEHVRRTPRVRTAVQHFFASRDRRDVPMLLHVEGQEPQPLGLALVCNTNPWTYLGPRPVQPCPTASLETGLDVFGLTSLPTVATLRHLRQILGD